MKKKVKKVKKVYKIKRKGELDKKFYVMYTIPIIPYKERLCHA